jgi:hypothetical protein
MNTATDKPTCPTVLPNVEIPLEIVGMQRMPFADKAKCNSCKDPF